MTTLRCPSDILITSLLFTARWSTWPGITSPGPTCGWVDMILHPDSCTLVSSWSKVPLLSIWSVAVPLCRPLLPCHSRWHGSLSWHGLWWLTCELHCSSLLCSGLCTRCERVHFFLVFLDLQTELPACLSNIWSRCPTDIETLSLGNIFSVV